MTISALLLSRQFYALGLRPVLAYATLGLLFVNVSVGGALTHFAAPPALLVANTWGWGSLPMLVNFRWIGAVGIVVVVVTEDYQSPLALRPAVLVGLFQAGLVIHGGLQQSWIEPVLGRLRERPLFFGSMALTAFNDNAAITYLATLVPSLTDGMKHAVVARALTGGGLTVIANAPNPAGQAILARHFAEGVSPLGLLLGALLPTAVVGGCFLLFG